VRRSERHPDASRTVTTQRLGDFQSTRLTNDQIRVPVLAFDVEADTRGHRGTLLPTYLGKTSTRLGTEGSRLWEAVERLDERVTGSARAAVRARVSAGAAGRQ
jgi:hypothetical protein